MQFRTEYIPKASHIRLDPRKETILIGSCFADNIGRLMRQSLWNAAVNPCGTLFNPVSMACVMRLALGLVNADSPWKGTDGIWRSWDFPTQFADLTSDGCALKCHQAITSLRSRLINGDTLIATFGTSIVYAIGDNRRIVANCHKQPAGMFHRTHTGVQEIVALWRSLVTDIRRLNPNMKIIFTVSPVRHIKEGFVENSRSKATLLLACEELCRSLEGCDYFPAYEIMNDDLRDYRFYTSDMAHPSPEAEEYIFSQFTKTFLCPEDRLLLEQGRALTRRHIHRPLIPDSETARKFKTDTASLIESWHRHNPSMLTPDRI